MKRLLQKRSGEHYLENGDHPGYPKIKAAFIYTRIMVNFLADQMTLYFQAVSKYQVTFLHYVSDLIQSS